MPLSDRRFVKCKITEGTHLHLTRDGGQAPRKNLQTEPRRGRSSCSTEHGRMVSGFSNRLKVTPGLVQSTPMKHNGESRISTEVNFKSSHIGGLCLPTNHFSTSFSQPKA